MVYQRYKVDEKLRVCKLIEKGYSTYWIERNLGIPDATTCRRWRDYSKGKSLEPSKKQEEKENLIKVTLQAVLTELDRNPSATNKQFSSVSR